MPRRGQRLGIRHYVQSERYYNYQKHKHYKDIYKIASARISIIHSRSTITADLASYRWTDNDATWQKASTQRTPPSWCFGGLGLLLTSPMQLQNRILRNLTQEHRHPTSCTKSVFSWRLFNNDDRPGQYGAIHVYFSATAKRSLTKFDSKQTQNRAEVHWSTIICKSCIARSDSQRFAHGPLYLISQWQRKRELPFLVFKYAW